MFPTKCERQNDRTNSKKTSCFCKSLAFMIVFAIKTWIFKLPPLLCLVCLTNSFWRRYVSGIHNRSNRSNRPEHQNTKTPKLKGKCSQVILLHWKTTSIFCVCWGSQGRPQKTKTTITNTLKQNSRNGLTSEFMGWTCDILV